MKPVTLRQAIKNVIQVIPGTALFVPDPWPEPEKKKRRRKERPTTSEPVKAGLATGR